MLELILPLLFLLVSLASAFLWACSFAPDLLYLEKLSLSIPVSLVVGAWVYLFASSALGVGQLAACASTAFLAALALCSALLAPTDLRAVAWGMVGELKENKFLCAILVAFVLLFGFLLSTHILEVSAGGVYSGGSTWADLQFHSSTIESFLSGVNSHFSLLDMRNPVLEGSNLYYPIIPDMASVALASAGASLRDAIIIPALLCAFSLVCITYFLFLRFSGSKRASALAFILLVLAGGIGFAYLFQDASASGKGLLGFLSSLPANYVYSTAGGQSFTWTSFVGEILLPQFSSRFAIPMVAGIFLLLLHGLDSAKANVRKNSFLLAGLIGGLLPFVQGQAVVSVAFVAGTVFLLDLAGHKGEAGSRFGEWLYFGLPAVALALPQLAYYLGQATLWGFARLAPLWPPSSSIFSIAWSFIRNLGLLVPLSILGWFLLDKRQKEFSLGFLVLFGVSSVVVFSPWDIDNLKLQYVACAMMCCIAAIAIEKLWVSRKPFAKLACILLVALLVASGSIALAYELESHYLLYNQNDLAVGNWALSSTPADSVFLSAGSLNPVSSISGRQLVEGYPGWLWSQGYNYSQQDADVKLMLAGGNESLALMKKYGVDYVFIGPTELQQNANQAFFSQIFPLAFSSGPYSIYSVGNSSSFP